MDTDDPLNGEQPLERFLLTAITEKVEGTRKLRSLFDTVPEAERGDVTPPFARPNFSEALNDFGGFLVCLTDGTPVACLMSYPYKVPLPNDAKGRTGDYYELGSIYVAPRYREYQLAEFLVAFAVMRHYLLTPEVWLRRIFAVSFPYQHPDQRAVDPSIPDSRGGMAHIFSASHLGFQPTTPFDGLLEVREAKGLTNSLMKLWWFAGDFVLEQAAKFLDGTRHGTSRNIFILGKKKMAWLDRSALSGLPNDSFADRIKGPSGIPSDPAD
jgi:hypothetical protein